MCKRKTILGTITQLCSPSYPEIQNIPGSCFSAKQGPVPASFEVLLPPQPPESPDLRTWCQPLAAVLAPACGCVHYFLFDGKEILCLLSIQR